MSTEHKPDRIHVKLKPREKFLVRGVEIPGYLWQEKPFVFNPQDFAIGNERLNDKIYFGETQTDSFLRFKENPRHPCIYGVASAPNDIKAKQFAAFLVQTFLENAPPNTTVLWEQLYGNTFKNSALEAEPSLIVITGLSPTSSNTKLEKARDLIEKHSNIPRIVVIAGEDPITFFSTRLYSPIHNLYFHSLAIVKRKVDVI